MPVVSMFAKTLSPWEAEAADRAKVEHGGNIAVRVNPQTWKVEYYNTKTGKIVSSHI